jgi:hypothetical protein
VFILKQYFFSVLGAFKLLLSSTIFMDLDLFFHLQFFDFLQLVSHLA